jgi:hypothetical protein
MKRVTLIATALVLAVLAVLAGGVAAQQTNTSERTFLTFSNTVEMPGVTLQPGTYVFKLADTGSRNVVQVWNEKEEQMLGHWLFVQTERLEVTQENVVMFRETPAGTTPAVQYWYFPGERVGKEFIYPRDQATRIAAATGSNVLTTEGTEVSSVDARGNVTAWEKDRQARVEAPSDSQGIVRESTAAGNERSADTTVSNAPAAAQPTAPAGSLAGNRGVEAQADTRDDIAADVDTRADASAQRQDSPAVAQAPARRPVGTSGAGSQVARADELPRTASPLALTGLIGLLSLAGAMGLRAFRG